MEYELDSKLDYSSGYEIDFSSDDEIDYPFDGYGDSEMEEYENELNGYESDEFEDIENEDMYNVDEFNDFFKEKVDDDVSNEINFRKDGSIGPLSFKYITLYLYNVKKKHTPQDAVINSFCFLLNKINDDYPKSFKTVKEPLLKNHRGYKFYFCSKCGKNVSMKTKCLRCDRQIPKQDMLIYKPIFEQVKFKFKYDAAFAESISKTRIDDSIDWWGKSTKSVVKMFENKPSDRVLYIGLYSDGLSLSNSSLKVAYPQLSILLNLPLRDRYKYSNILMNTLVTFTNKPKHVETILIPIINELLFFKDNMFEVYNCFTKKKEKINLCAVLFLSDMELQRSVLYFGDWMRKFGCNCCLKEFEKHGRKFYCSSNPIRGRMRTKNSKQGVFGISILRFLSYFDIVRQVPNDTMHLFWCNGVFSKMLNHLLKQIPDSDMRSIQERIYTLCLTDEYGLFFMFFIFKSLYSLMIHCISS